MKMIGPLPADALDQHVAILAKTGAGKTVLAKSIAEKLLDQNARVCAIDPTGAWWGLRLKADGRTPAYDVAIFGGRHADAPIGKNSGQRLAQIIGAGNVPSIIDTSLMTVSERTHFFTEFAEAIYRENEGPLHLFIDEAHLFAPQQRVSSPQSGAMLHAANNLVSGGRSRGFCITLISQRAAKLHKDSLTQVETLVAMRLIAPQDRDAVKAWLGEWSDDPNKSREILRSLPSLERGEGWVWSPELGVLERKKFGMCKTFDSSKAPKAGDAKREPRKLQSKEIAELVALIDKPVAPKAIAGSPAIANAATKKQLGEEYRRGFNEATATMKAMETKEVERVAADNHRAGWNEAISWMQKTLADAGARRTTRGVELPSKVYAAAKTTPAPKVWPKSQITPREIHVQLAPGGTVAPGMMRVLEAIAFWEALDIPTPSRQQTSAASGLKLGTLRNYCGKLAAQGLIETPSTGTLRLTQQGREIAPQPDRGIPVRERLKAILSPGLERVIDAMPRDASPMARADIAAETQFELGTLRNYIGKLSQLGLVRNSQAGSVVAEPWIWSR